MKPLKGKYGVTLDPDVASDIKTLAELDDRNFSQYINLILKAHVERKRKEGLLDQNAK